MPNILPCDRQIEVLKLLAEGNSIRSIVRFTRVHKKTVLRLLVNFGDQCRDFLSDKLRGLTLRHVQCEAGPAAGR